MKVHVCRFGDGMMPIRHRAEFMGESVNFHRRFGSGRPEMAFEKIAWSQKKSPRDRGEMSVRIRFSSFTALAVFFFFFRVLVVSGIFATAEAASILAATAPA